MSERGGMSGRGDDEPDALERLRLEQERRWAQFRADQEEAARRLSGEPPDEPVTRPDGPVRRPAEPVTRPADPTARTLGGEPAGGLPTAPGFGSTPPGYRQQPVGQPGYGTQQTGWGGRPPGFSDPTDPRSTWSVALALLSWPLTFACGIGLITAVVALVLGIQSAAAIRRSEGRLQGSGQAMAGVIISALYLVTAAVAVLALVAVGMAWDPGATTVTSQARS